MKKFIVLVVLLIIAKPFSLLSDLPLAIGLDYSNFNRQNQIVGTIIPFDIPVDILISVTDKRGRFFLSKFELINISVGFRSSINYTPEFISRITLINLDFFRPFIFAGTRCEEGSSGDIAEILEERSLMNYKFGLTIINYDKTQIQDLLLQWVQIRGGLGISTQDRNIFIRNANFDSFLTMKLGYSSINLGEYNLKNFFDNNKYFKCLESGLNLNIKLKYKEIISFKTDLDYTFFKTESMINKIGFGLGIDFFNYFHSPVNKQIHDGVIKFSLNSSYNKYYFQSNYKEFFKLDIGAKYYFPF